MLGSQLVITALKRHHVTTIFSLSGNQIMPLYDACIDAGIRIVHVRHEAAAVFMADAWAQVTGEIGVAMLTAGPGITNGVAPLYSAAQAESPVLLISGDSSTAEDGLGAFQEMDQTAITSPLTKISYRPTSAAELARCVDEVISIALNPRRGPVHLALPFDLLTQESGIHRLPDVTPSLALPSLSTLDQTALHDVLANAERPLILAGPTWARAHMHATRSKLETALQLPIVPMESPRGLKDPSCGDLAGLIAQADVIVLAGKVLDFTLAFGRNPTFHADARIVVIDPDTHVLDRSRRMLGTRLHSALQSDPAMALQALGEASLQPKRADWIRQASDSLASRAIPNAVRPPFGALSPQALCEAVQEFLGGANDPILICDGGEFGQWAQAFCNAPIRVINGMSGAIGGGICYAIAAKIARPQSTVVALMGDGTSGFHFMEMDTAVREQASFVAIIGNDLRWNAEHLIQMRTYGKERLLGCELAESARYHEAATALGALGANAHTAAEVTHFLRTLHEASKAVPLCINVAIDGQAAPVFSGSLNASSSH
ncbi:thiamine pyrophosphate-binding protein [Diaphorobacter sp. HDW4A]|uniref:thiamine pyrophosphate-binding protein n=1 Tax=Diaphorobacter sp. HDW4A TaxID=2714924 RepID=UPI00140B8CBA|nr:thiamine pyrophosphate-binding protein [Diaphorobacter sp. HDW4A]QIL81176.1 thiamine pyrophosphate-binding protein [Diaphorobacter sp. HDW4A]